MAKHDIMEPDPAVSVANVAPHHVALIADDAEQRSARLGHAEFGECCCRLEALRRVALAAIDLNIPFLTVCSCSLANWSRPAKEARGLIRLLKRAIKTELAYFQANNIRVRVIGARADLASDLAALLYEVEQVTAANRALTLVVAFNYTARQEITGVVRALARGVAAGRITAAEIDVDAISARLGPADIPDPDLIIGLSGGQCLSNLLLWQAAYAEFMFLPIDWRDFDKAVFESAVADYARRDRRFGQIREPEHATKAKTS